MHGLMQSWPLLTSTALRHAARHHGGTEIVSRAEPAGLHRTSYAGLERRARRLASALRRLGIGAGERIGTLAWNSARHLEVYYAVSGMGAVCHTLNPRLSLDDLAYIAGHATDRVLFVDPPLVPLIEALAPLLAGQLRAVVMLTDQAAMPAVTLPDGIELLCHDALLQAQSDDFGWPVLDENDAALLCYTSGTTGRPKGVLYSHRSTMLHAWGLLGADAMALRAVDRVLPVVPMFHVNAWGLPFAAAMAGSALVLPGRYLDGASLAALMNDERVTIAAGVPTVWLGLLQHLRASGERLATLQRLTVGGSACPAALMAGFEQDYDVRVNHAWGMTETSPVATFNRPNQTPLDPPAAARRALRQGRALFGVDFKIVDADGAELQWDGESFGNLLVRGPWVCTRYFGADTDGADAEGWFPTGDVATIDPDGYMEIVDRSKDVIKSGGEWISSVALENMAIAHPDVAEAAVIAARHPKWDERPLLLVVPRAGRTIDPAALRESYRGQVPDWSIPDAVLVLDELPHTATGKLHKLELRRRYADALLSDASR